MHQCSGDSSGGKLEAKDKAQRSCTFQAETVTVKESRKPAKMQKRRAGMQRICRGAAGASRQWRQAGEPWSPRTHEQRQVNENDNSWQQREIVQENKNVEKSRVTIAEYEALCRRNGSNWLDGKRVDGP